MNDPALSLIDQAAQHIAADEANALIRTLADIDDVEWLSWAAWLQAASAADREDA
jgi:hypothetical protein